MEGSCKKEKNLLFILIEDAMRRGTAAPAFRVGGLVLIFIDVDWILMIFNDFHWF